MVKRATKKRNRRRLPAGSRCANEELEELVVGFTPDAYRLGLLLFFEGSRPDWLLPSHHREIEEFARTRNQVTQDKTGAVDLMAVLRSVAMLTIPMMITAVMTGAGADFDRPRFIEEVETLSRELVEAGVQIGPAWSVWLSSWTLRGSGSCLSTGRRCARTRASARR